MESVIQNQKIFKPWTKNALFGYLGWAVEKLLLYL